jgi:hypothetical protein
LFHVILLIPSWESQSADPEEKRREEKRREGPREISNLGDANSLKALDITWRNREDPN